jgi:hypothetical protein
MKMTIRTVLLTMILSGVAQAQVERNGWKLVYVDYYDEKGMPPLENKAARIYGEPSFVIFVKDSPRQAGDKYPRLLMKEMYAKDFGETATKSGPSQVMSLLEFDCGRSLCRTVKILKSDGTKEEPESAERWRWLDVSDLAPYKAMLDHACRPRTAPKK